MDLVDALTRVLELARIAISEFEIDSHSHDPDKEACNLVEDYIVNELGDD